MLQMPHEERVKRPSRPRHEKTARKRKIAPLARRYGLTRIWSLKKADATFSAEILARDTKCQFPGCNRTDQLTCSHYFGRVCKATRFDKDNCVILCRKHHYWDKMLGFEFQKQRKEVHGWDGQYTLFMKNRLGPTRWYALIERSMIPMKQTVAIAEYQRTKELL